MPACRKRGESAEVATGQKRCAEIWRVHFLGVMMHRHTFEFLVLLLEILET